MASLHPLSRTYVRHSAEASILGNGPQSQFGKANQSVRPWAALRHHAAPKAKSNNDPIRNYDYWAQDGSTYQLQKRENETIEPHLHTCFAADRRRCAVSQCISIS